MYRVPTSSTVIHFERTAEIASFGFSRADVGLPAIDDQTGLVYQVVAVGLGAGCLASISKPGTVQLVTLTPAANVVVDLGGAASVRFTLLLDRDPVMQNPANAPAGAMFWVTYAQGPGAPWVPSFGNAYRHQSGDFVPGATEVGRSDTVGYMWNGSAAEEFSRATDV